MHLTLLSVSCCLWIRIIKEEKCISFFFSLPNSWDNLVVAIGSNNATLKIDGVVTALLLEEMRQKAMERLTPEALLVKG